MTDSELLDTIQSQQLLVNANEHGVKVLASDGRTNTAADIRGALWPFAATSETKQEKGIK